MKIIPKFINFYKSLSDNEIMAVKYYKVHGSYLQTYYLTTDPEKLKINFPFQLNNLHAQIIQCDTQLDHN